MAIGFVLVKTVPNTLREVHSLLGGLEGLKEITPIFGEYDLILQMETETVQDLGSIVVNKIRTAPDVLSTRTLQAVDFSKN